MEVLQSFNNVTIATLISFISPLIAFVVIGLFGNIYLPRRGDVVAVILTVISFLSSVYVFINTWNITEYSYSKKWLDVGIIKIDVGIYIDNLSSLLLMMITFITSLVMIYSIGYMKNEKYYARYFSHLSLFLFAMLGIVLADSLLLLYIFWEIVGFASYLLIGFWFQKNSAALACKKAFLVNKVGDIAFFIGMVMLLIQFKTLDIKTLFGAENGILVNIDLQQQGISIYWLTITGLLIFCGALAKSAQFPLHIWLPDAMEGPTSVSSLIHAATMVAAGVYLTARVFPLFTDTAVYIISILGSLTAITAASIALVQNDIKKVLAYSTISQLGFMITAVAIGAWQAALLHLVTHAFFKCLLFLSAGSVIHSFDYIKNKYNIDFDTQDMRNMGGVKKYMPKTFIVFLIAALSISGVPLFSGFLSKDFILLHALEYFNMGGSVIPITLLLIAAILTSFYIFRLIFLTFFSQNRLAQKYPEIEIKHLHDPQAVMIVPMIVLAMFSMFFAFGYNPFIAKSSWIVEGLVYPGNSFIVSFTSFKGSALLPIFIIIATICSISLAYISYVKKKISFIKEGSSIYNFFFNAYYFDKLYVMPTVAIVKLFARFMKIIDYIIDGFVNGVSAITRRCASFIDLFDRNVIDGFVNGVAETTEFKGQVLRKYQTGSVQDYIIMSVAVVALLIITLLMFL